MSDGVPHRSDDRQGRLRRGGRGLAAVRRGRNDDVARLMATVISLDDLPDDVRRELGRRAAEAGRTVEEQAREELIASTEGRWSTLARRQAERRSGASLATIVEAVRDAREQ